jgi:hypothetical protein
MVNLCTVGYLVSLTGTDDVDFGNHYEEAYKHYRHLISINKYNNELVVSLVEYKIKTTFETVRTNAD